MGDELVELFDADQFLDVVQEGEALFVGDGAEGVVGVLAFEVRDELGEVVVFAELGDGVGQGFPADDGGEVAVLVAAVDFALDAAFEVDGPAFVEPEVFPGGVADEVAGPAVGEFVGNNVDILTVAGDEGRRGEGIDWVF